MAMEDYLIDYTIYADGVDLNAEYERYRNKK